MFIYKYYIHTNLFVLSKKKIIRFFKKKKKENSLKNKKNREKYKHVQLKHSLYRFSNLINLKIPLQIKFNSFPFYFPCLPLEKGKQTDNTLKNTLFAHCSIRFDSYFVCFVYTCGEVYTQECGNWTEGIWTVGGETKIADRF